MPFLVTGCGRSGTGWASALFTALGYPCGHEVMFSQEVLDGSFDPMFEDGLAQSESSWLAVPYVHRLPEETPVLRIMRDPYAVVRSIMARGFLATLDEPYAGYVTRHRPDITFTPDHLGRAIRYTALWDESLSGAPLLRVDAGPDAVVALILHVTGDKLGRDTVTDALQLLDSSINTNVNPGPAPSVDQINNHPDSALLSVRAKEFGYL